MSVKKTMDGKKKFKRKMVYKDVRRSTGERRPAAKRQGRQSNRRPKSSDIACQKELTYMQ